MERFEMTSRPVDKVFLERGGMATYMTFNEDHDDGLEHDGIAGCFEVHRLMPSQICRCFEECGPERFWGNIAGYVSALRQSTWCDADCDGFHLLLRDYAFSPGYLLENERVAACAAIMANANALDALDEEGRWETEDGYRVLAKGNGNALVHRASSCKWLPYVAAWSFDEKAGAWSQGHYYDDLLEAWTAFKDLPTG